MTEVAVTNDCVDVLANGSYPDHPDLVEARREIDSLRAERNVELLGLYLDELLPIHKRHNEQWHLCLTSSEGKLVGMELANMASSMFALILEDPTEPGRYRAQYFADCGFTGHATYDAPLFVFIELLREGFNQPAAGSLNRLCQTHRWRIGMQTAYLIENLNRGVLSYESFVAERAQLTAV